MPVETPFEAHYRTNDSFFEANVDGSPFENARLLVGTSVSYLTGSVPRGNFAPKWSETWWNIYAEANYEFESLKLILGTQYNKTENFKGKWVPRLGVIVDLSPHLSAKILYGEAFRAPFIAENFVAIPEINLFGNPNLAPETVQTVDLALLHADSGLQWGLTLFWSKQKNLIVRKLQEDATTTMFENAQELETLGLEFEAKAALFEDWYVMGSYTLQGNKSADGTRDYTMQPNHVAKLGIGFANEYLSVGIFDSVLSSYRDNIRRSPTRAKLNPASKVRNDLSLKISLDLNALTRRDLHPRLRLEFYGSNLTDQNTYLPTHSGDPHVAVNTLHAGAGVHYMFYLRGEF